MNVRIFILVCFLSFVGLAESKAKPYKVLYVSSSIGNDSNKGDNPNNPLKTIAAALNKADTIKLKAGDVFYEHARVEKTVLTRYGNGVNPLICGYKRIITPNWEQVSNNVWKLDLTQDNFSGVVLSGPSMSNNIGFFHEFDKDVIHGFKHQYLKELKQDWDFFQTEVNRKDMDPAEFNFVYLYLTNDPNQLKLELSTCNIPVELRNSTLKNVNIKGFSVGVTVFFGANIFDCRIDAIGGRSFINSKKYCCSGNGIEFWVGQYDIKDSSVSGCYISRCYDCGISIQGTCVDGLSPHNVIIKENLITNCCQGWEDFLSHDDAFYDNCSFENNKVIFSGESGWGYPESRFKRCHVLQNNNHGLKGMVFKNNVFISGNFYCSSTRDGDYSSAVWQDNVCYIEKGKYLMGNYYGTKNVVRIPLKDGSWRKYRQEKNDALAFYRSKVKDISTKFVVVSPQKAKRLGNRAIKNFVKDHTY